MLLDGAVEFGSIGANGEESMPVSVGDVVNVRNWLFSGLFPCW